MEATTTKTRAEIESRLAEVEADERLHYPIALVQVNTPLALIQTKLRNEANTLRWVLGMPLRQYHGKDDGEARSVCPCDKCVAWMGAWGSANECKEYSMDGAPGLCDDEFDLWVAQQIPCKECKKPPILNGPNRFGCCLNVPVGPAEWIEANK